MLLGRSLSILCLSQLQGSDPAREAGGPAPPGGWREETEGKAVLFRLLWDVEFWKMFPELPEAKFISPCPGGRRDPGDD